MASSDPFGKVTPFAEEIEKLPNTRSFGRRNMM